MLRRCNTVSLVTKSFIHKVKAASFLSRFIKVTTFYPMSNSCCEISGDQFWHAFISWRVHTSSGTSRKIRKNGLGFDFYQQYKQKCISWSSGQSAAIRRKITSRAFEFTLLTTAKTAYEGYSKKKKVQRYCNTRKSHGLDKEELKKEKSALATCVRGHSGY